MENVIVIDKKIYEAFDEKEKNEWQVAKENAEKNNVSLFLVQTKVRISETQVTEVIQVGITKGVNVLLQTQQYYGHKGLSAITSFFENHILEIY
jgi:hypothetical protein